MKKLIFLKVIVVTTNNKKKDLIGKYSLKSFPRNRQLLSDIYDEFQKKHYMNGLIEVNTTKGRTLINKYNTLTAEKLSFASWIVKCIAESVKEHPEVNSFRKGKSKVIQFEDIDIVLMIEKFVQGQPIAIPYSIRKCNEKSVVEISKEIRRVRSIDSTEKDQLTEQGLILKFYPFAPKFLRQIVIRRMIKNPFYIKKQGGVIVVTSVSAFTTTSGWVMGFGGMLTMSIALGGKSLRQRFLDDKIVEEEFLQMTISIDHDIIDGAPAARFISTLVTNIESGRFLEK